MSDRQRIEELAICMYAAGCIQDSKDRIAFRKKQVNYPPWDRLPEKVKVDWRKEATMAIAAGKEELHFETFKNMVEGLKGTIQREGGPTIRRITKRGGFRR